MRDRYRSLSPPPPPPRRSHCDDHRPSQHTTVDPCNHQFMRVDEPKRVNLRENELVSSKFDWENLLHNSGSHYERNVMSSSPFSHNDDFGSVRKFGGVVPTTTSMSMDPIRRITFSSYGLVQNRKISDGLNPGMHRRDESLLVGSSSKHGGSSRAMEDYNFLSERYGDVMRERGLAEKGGHYEGNVKDLGGDGVVYGRREMSLEPSYRGETRWVEDSGVKRGISGGIGSSRDGYERMPISYHGSYGVESGPRTERHVLEGDLDMDDCKEIMQKRPRFDTEPTRHDQKRRFYNWGVTDNEVYDTVNETGQWSDEDTESLTLHLDSAYGRIASRTNNEMMINGNSNFNCRIPLSNHYFPESKKSHERKSVKTPKRDIKSRLEFPGSVKQRLGIPEEMHMRQNVKASKSNLKQRLGSAPSSRNYSRHGGTNHRKLPWMKMQEQRCLEHLDCSNSLQHLDGSNSLHGVKSSDVKTTKKKNHNELMKVEPHKDFEFEEKISKKIEPPEDSIEFMQLVQSAYLKYVKVLCENSAKRRKYTEQGGRGPFMCSICGSSEEFGDTLSLAQHAFTSCKVGTRSEHLGFHKALCVLMGWTSADVPSSPWVRQIMPDTEAISLKEDLIIWPPIVIVHNSSIACENPDDRLLVSIEGLWDILRGMGFGQWMTNVCRGKAANQSTMVVAFKGTFSGLREAQRLHRLYAENKRGRFEFEPTVSGSANESKAEGQGIQADSVVCKAEGQGIQADIVESKAEGQGTQADIVESKAEGQGILADIVESKAEGQEIPANSRESKAEAKGIPADSVLYGYMGIASDLDKVDFETKRRSVVKSKKDIEAIADASLAPE